MNGALTIFNPSQEADELREENARLSAALKRANAEAVKARDDASRALLALRKQLQPLHNALRMIFGELDAAGVNDKGPVSNGDPRVSAVWENWKARMPGAPAQVINALLLHRDLSQQQLCVATGVPRGSMTNVISRLNKAGLINKNGGRISLKAL